MQRTDKGRDVIKDLFGILIYVNMNVINRMRQDNVQTIKILDVEKN